MQDFRRSETLKNLMRAFAGESQARNRYTFAAGVAEQEKLPVIEAVFQFTADQEKEHGEIFYNYMKELTGENIHIDGAFPINISQKTLDLLKAARHNEYEEHDVVYKAFGDKAKEEGFEEIGRAFHQIAAIEKVHGDRFGMLADLMEQNRLFLSDVATGWMCLNCGHILTATQAPAMCPVCRHEQGYFIRLELAPYTLSFRES